MDTYEIVDEICEREIKAHSPTEPGLFDRITDLLAAAGVKIDQAATAKARTESPNVIAVFQGNEDAPEEMDYIEVLGQDVTIWGYHGDTNTELLTLAQVMHYYDEPGVNLEDLAGLRYIERDGEKLYDETDLQSISDRKTAEAKARMEAHRNLTLVLPDEFLKLCDSANTTPEEVLASFVADLCDLQQAPYITRGSDERMYAEQYFERCGYVWMADQDRDEERQAMKDQLKAKAGGQTT